MRTKTLTDLFDVGEKVRTVIGADQSIADAIRDLEGDILFQDIRNKKLHLIPDAVVDKSDKRGKEFMVVLDSSIKDASQELRNWKVAVALGHLFLHMGYLFDDHQWNASKKYVASSLDRWDYPMEKNEAERFALGFLCPGSRLQEMLGDFADEHGNIDLEDCAARLSLPPGLLLEFGKHKQILSD